MIPAAIAAAPPMAALLASADPLTTMRTNVLNVLGREINRKS
jgi:hypothetical protein